MSARAKVTARLPGLNHILSEMRNSGDADRIADGAFILGALGDIAEVGEEMKDRLRDAATVIERMANGAPREECSPELDRVIATLREIDAGEAEEESEAVTAGDPYRKLADALAALEEREPSCHRLHLPPSAPNATRRYNCPYCNEAARLRDEGVVVDRYVNVCHEACLAAALRASGDTHD